MDNYVVIPTTMEGSRISWNVGRVGKLEKSRGDHWSPKCKILRCTQDGSSIPSTTKDLSFSWLLVLISHLAAAGSYSFGTMCTLSPSLTFPLNAPAEASTTYADFRIRGPNLSGFIESTTFNTIFSYQYTKHR